MAGGWLKAKIEESYEALEGMSHSLAEREFRESLGCGARKTGRRHKRQIRKMVSTYLHRGEDSTSVLWLSSNTNFSFSYSNQEAWTRRIWSQGSPGTFSPLFPAPRLAWGRGIEGGRVFPSRPSAASAFGGRSVRSCRRSLPGRGRVSGSEGSRGRASRCGRRGREVRESGSRSLR